MDLKDIKAVVELMRKNSISEFEMENQGFKIKLKRGTNGAVLPASYDDLSPAPVLTAAPSVGLAALPAAAPVLSSDMEVKSPMIGTFYRAPSPESGPYVEVGTEVGPDTVVCIIEAMKVMNEIKAEVKGVISKVLVENAKPVEYGQPMFKVRPN